jgi:hypothetical protein
MKPEIKQWSGHINTVASNVFLQYNTFHSVRHHRHSPAHPSMNQPPLEYVYGTRQQRSHEDCIIFVTLMIFFLRERVVMLGAQET